MNPARESIPRDELAAAVETRAELGADYEPEVIEGFVDRLGEQIDARVDARLAERGVKKNAKGDGSRGSMWLPLLSLVLGIPITAVAGGTGGSEGVIVAWAAIVMINIAYNLKNVRRGRD